MPTIQKLASKLNQEIAKSLIRNVRAMPADKVTWAPLEKGRTALAQLQECTVITGFTIYTLQKHELPADFNEAFAREAGEMDTVEKAIARLEERSAILGSVIEAFPDADLDKTIKMPWEEEPSSLAELMFMNYWNNAYHVGQIAYIQTLYGDSEMH